MAYYHEPNMLRASSSGFAWGRMVFTDYKSACLRKILVQSRGMDSESIDPKYILVGALNEERHEKRQTGAYVREVPFRISGGPEDVSVRGHADFVHYSTTDLDPDDPSKMKPVSVDELKSCTSKNTRRNVIKNGVYVIENLAQLICYMAAFKVPRGRLIYTYWEHINNEWRPMDERIFEVDIDDFGRICVDSKPSQYTIYDLFAHRQQAFEAIAFVRVQQRPHRWDAPFGSPCGYCHFKSACDAWDAGEIEGDGFAFVDYAVKHKGVKDE
jgi:hypothetical protein